MTAVALRDPRQFGNIVPGAFTPVLAKHSSVVTMLRLQTMVSGLQGGESSPKLRGGHKSGQ